MSNHVQALVRGLAMKAPLKPILNAYADYADALGYSWAGVDTIAFDTGYGVTTVKDARKQLIADKWMASKRRYGTSSIVRLNLDLMASQQVDRGEGKLIHPELEFAPEPPRSDPVSREAANRKLAGQTQTAASRLTDDPQVEHEQPPRGYSVSREAANYSAASRPLSIRDPSDDPSVRAIDGSMDGPAEAEQKTSPTTEAMALIVDLEYGSHTRPTERQANELGALVDAAVARGLDWRTIRQHAQGKVNQAKRNAIAYLTVGLAAENLPAVRTDAQRPGSAATTRSGPSRGPLTRARPAPDSTLLDLPDGAMLPSRLQQAPTGASR